MDELDQGSDLSDLSSPPQTPGQAATPQTSPLHHNKARQSSPTSFLPSSNKKVSGKQQSIETSSGRAIDSDTFTKGKKGNKKKSKGQEGGKDDSWIDSDAIISSPKAVSPPQRKGSRGSRGGKLNSVKVDSEESKSIEAESSTPAKKHPGWAYVPMEEPSSAQTSTVVEGKRDRKRTQQYTAAPKQAPEKRNSTSVDNIGREEESSITPSSEKEAKPLVPEEEAVQPRQHLKIKIHLTKKRKDDESKAVVDDVPEEEIIRQDSQEDLVMEDEDDEAQPSRKRKRAQKARQRVALVDEEDEAGDDDDDDDDDDDAGPRKSKPKGHTQHRKKKSKESKRKTKARKEEVTFDAEEGSDDYEEEGKASEEDFISDDADEEVEAAKKGGMIDKAKSFSSLPRLKRKSESMVGGHQSKKVDGGKSNEPLAVKNAATGKVSTLQPQPPRPTTTTSTLTSQVKPTPPKAAIRKVPSMNLFDNLMGYSGSKPKDTTPSKGPAIKARPSGSGLNTPQASSPMIRPLGSNLKKEGDAKTSTPTRTASSTTTTPIAGSALSKSSTEDGKAVNGQQVTAVEMARRKEQATIANSNPKDLFDLLEGAEVMMQFEDETRQSLPFDSLIARYKLYRLSRTEGLPKLVDRIKESIQREKLQGSQ